MLPAKPPSEGDGRSQLRTVMSPVGEIGGGSWRLVGAFSAPDIQEDPQKESIQLGEPLARHVVRLWRVVHFVLCSSWSLRKMLDSQCLYQSCCGDVAVLWVWQPTGMRVLEVLFLLPRKEL